MTTTVTMQKMNPASKEPVPSYSEAMMKPPQEPAANPKMVMYAKILP